MPRNPDLVCRRLRLGSTDFFAVCCCCIYCVLVSAMVAINDNILLSGFLDICIACFDHAGCSQKCGCFGLRHLRFWGTKALFPVTLQQRRQRLMGHSTDRKPNGKERPRFFNSLSLSPESPVHVVCFRADAVCAVQNFQMKQFSFSQENIF